MKTQKFNSLSKFQKIMVVIIPLIVLLLIAAIGVFASMIFTHSRGAFTVFRAGNVVIIMALSSSLLALVGIVFAVFSAGSDDEDAE